MNKPTRNLCNPLSVKLIWVFVWSIVIALGVQPLKSMAQNTQTVQGQVKDLEGTPIIAANLKLEGTSYISISNSNGEFQFKNIPYGKYQLTVTSIGFEKQTISIKVSEKNSKPLSITLLVKILDIDAITIKGRTAAQETNRQAFNVTAIDAKKLYNSNADLADALDRVAGVRVRESGGVGSSFNFAINGFSGNRVKFFIDGVPIDNFGSSFQVNNIPINLADRLEVYKGVVPIWLGSDALGGAVNIVTNTQNLNYIDASYSIGSFNTHKTTLGAAVTSKKGLTFQLNAFQNYSNNNYRVKVDAANIYTGAYAPGTWVNRFHDTYHNETVIANVGVVNKTYADNLLVGVVLGQNYKELQTGARMVTVFGKWNTVGNVVMPTLKYRKDNIIKGLDLNINANYNLGTEQSIDTANVRYDWFGNSKPNGTNGESQRTLAKYKNNNGIVSAMANYRLGERHSIAINNVFNTFDRKGADPLNSGNSMLNGAKKTQKNVLGIGYTYQIAEKYSVSVFGKNIRQLTVNGPTRNEIVTTRTGYGTAATIFIRKDLQLKGSYELTNRMPEARELFGEMIELIEANPNLAPEQSHNINAGFAYSKIIKKSNISVQGSGIYRYAYDFIYTKFNNNQNKYTTDNRDGVRTIAADGEIRYTYNNWLSIGANATYQFIQNFQKVEPGYTGVSPLYKDQMPNIPYFFGNADASVIFNDLGFKNSRLTIGYNALFVEEFYLYWPSLGSDKLGIPRQLSHDINITYSLKNGTYNIALEGRNITNTLVYDNFSLQKPGRAFYLKLRYFLKSQKQ